MQFLDGYKMIIGSLFLAATYFVTNSQPLFTPETHLILKLALGTIGVFMTGIGFAGKCDKIAK